MGAYKVHVLTEWRFVNGSYEMGIAIDHPSSEPRGWADVTGQPFENLTPAPNVFIAIGDLTQAVLDNILADPAYGPAAVLLIEEPIWTE